MKDSSGRELSPWDEGKWIICPGVTSKASKASTNNPGCYDCRLATEAEIKEATSLEP